MPSIKTKMSNLRFFVDSNRLLMSGAIFSSESRGAPERQRILQQHDLLLKDFCLRWCLSGGVCGRAALVSLQKSGSYFSLVVADTLMDRGVN